MTILDTALLVILGAGLVGNTILLSLIYVLLRDRKHVRELRESTRRDWTKVERT